MSEKTSTVLRSTILIMFITHTLTHVAGSIRSSIFPIIKTEFLLTNQQIGYISAIPALSTALITIPAGYLSDRFGAKKLISLSIILALIGALLAGFSTGLVTFVIATTLLTLNSTFYHPPANSFTTKNAEEGKQATALGFLNAGGTLGFALGPLSVSVLMGSLGFEWRTIYLFWVAPITLGLIALSFLRPISHSTEEVPDEINDSGETERTLLSRDMKVFLLSSGVRRLGGSMSLVFLSIYLVESLGWNLGVVGLMLGISRLMGLFASPLGGILASRYGEKKIAVLSLVASYTCFLFAFLLKGVVVFSVLYIVSRFFGSMSMPASSSMVATLIPATQRGVGFALSFLPGTFMQVIAPIIAGFMADYIGLYTVFLISVAVSFIGVGLLQFGVKMDT